MNDNPNELDASLELRNRDNFKECMSIKDEDYWGMSDDVSCITILDTIFMKFLKLKPELHTLEQDNERLSTDSKKIAKKITGSCN